MLDFYIIDLKLFVFFSLHGQCMVLLIWNVHDHIALGNVGFSNHNNLAGRVQNWMVACK